MADLRFTWDPRKARDNLSKHGVSFDEAATAFADERALVIADPEHSGAEDRFVLLGLSARLRLLVVVHAYRQQEDVIRVISARKSTRTERRAYVERWDQ